VMDFWGRRHGFTQLGVPSVKRGWASLSRHHPILRVKKLNVSEMFGAVVRSKSDSPLDGDCLENRYGKKADSSAADVHITSRVGWPRAGAGPAWGVRGGSGGRPTEWGNPWWLIPPSSTVPLLGSSLPWVRPFCPFGSVSQLCASACWGGGAGATFLWIFAVFWCESLLSTVTICPFIHWANAAWGGPDHRPPFMSTRDNEHGKDTSPLPPFASALTLNPTKPSQARVAQANG
jgi:hypothetical protein